MVNYEEWMQGLTCWRVVRQFIDTLTNQRGRPFDRELDEYDHNQVIFF